MFKTKQQIKTFGRLIFEITPIELKFLNSNHYDILNHPKNILKFIRRH